MSSSALLFVITIGLCLNKRDAVEAVGAGRIAMTSTLKNLIAAIPSDQILSIEGNLASEISAPVVESSSEVKPGGLFVARAGQAADGHQYIPDAIATGAAAIIGESEQTDLPVPYVRVRNAQQITGSAGGGISRLTPRASWSSSVSPAPTAKPRPVTCFKVFSNSSRILESATSVRLRPTSGSRPRRPACTSPHRAPRKFRLTCRKWSKPD